MLDSFSTSPYSNSFICYIFPSFNNHISWGIYHFHPFPDNIIHSPSALTRTSIGSCSSYQFVLFSIFFQTLHFTSPLQPFNRVETYKSCDLFQSVLGCWPAPTLKIKFSASILSIVALACYFVKPHNSLMTEFLSTNLFSNILISFLWL